MSNDQHEPVEPDLRDDAEVEALEEAGGEKVDTDEVEGPNSA